MSEQVIPKDDLGYPIAGWEELLDRANVAEAKVEQLIGDLHAMCADYNDALRITREQAATIAELTEVLLLARDGGNRLPLSYGIKQRIDAVLSKQVQPKEAQP